MKTIQSFQELEIPASIKLALQAMSFSQPTPIQAQAIPAALDGRDVVGTAQTGTGKTAAFGVPLLSALYTTPGKQALILAPTRELAAQIHKVLRQISKGSQIQGSLVVGGESFARQRREMEDGVDYLVATPGRLNDHLKEQTVDLSRIGILVLDEVDRMLDMGFLPQLRSIFREIPRQRQTLLFSATLPKEVQSLVDGLVQKPIRVAVGDVARPTSNVKEEIRRLSGQEEKNIHLMNELRAREGRRLVFVRTKSRTHRVARLLDREGMHAVIMHGGRSQAQRKAALERFRREENGILVATDLAGRGLDVVGIDHVINYDVPQSREDYIHRIGRTGRAGGSGSAVSFIVEGETDEEFVVTGKRPERKPSAPKAARPQGRPSQPSRREFSGPRRESNGPRREASAPRAPEERHREIWERPERPAGRRPSHGQGQGPRREARHGGERREFGGERREFGGPRRDFGGSRPQGRRPSRSR